MGYSTENSVWWGHSIGATMVSGHLNYLLQNSSLGHTPRAMVMTASASQYCYAFAPIEMKKLQSTPLWSHCAPGFGLFATNCCPAGDRAVLLRAPKRVRCQTKTH